MKKLLLTMSVSACVATIVGCASKPPPNDNLEAGMGPISTVKMVSKEKMESDMAANSQSQIQNENEAISQGEQGRAPGGQPGIPASYASAAKAPAAASPQATEEDYEKPMSMPVDKTYPGAQNAVSGASSSKQLSSDEPTLPQGESPHYSIADQGTDPQSAAAQTQNDYSENIPDEPSQSTPAPLKSSMGKEAPASSYGISPDDSSFDPAPTAQGQNTVSPDEPVFSQPDSSMTQPQGYSARSESEELKQLNNS